MSNTSSSTLSHKEETVPATIPTTILNQQEPVITTTSASTDYIEACARSNQKASLNEPLTLLFQAEKLAPLPNEPTNPTNHPTSRPACDLLWARLSKLSSPEIERMIYDSSTYRLTEKCKYDGAFIAEAGKFAAVTCWESVYAPDPPLGWEAMCGPDAPDWDVLGMLDNMNSNGIPMSRIVKERPIYGEFWMKMEIAKYRYLYPLIWRRAQLRKAAKSGVISGSVDREDLKFWYICLTSRNPAVQPPVPGVVRAVIQPIARRLIEEEDIPAIWIVAGGERARDVYEYFGFKVVQEIIVGTDKAGQSIKSWCMIYTKDGQRS